MAKLLVVDDDRAARRTLELAFGELGFDVFTAGTVKEGLAAWREEHPDCILLDLMLPDGDGLEVLEAARGEGLGGVVIMITGHQDLDRAITAMRAGAQDYIHKPLNLDELEHTVQNALALEDSRRKPALIADLARGEPGEKIIGRSRAMVEVHKLIGLASRGRANVLITGESGTGKELVARAIHRYTSPDEPFIPVNCSALAPTLLESELFGHERGAFTGATQGKPGRFELAGSGTLFLDEIGDLDLSLQVKLLRVLQERSFERVGGTRSLSFDARVVCATHRDLLAMVREGTFREDLYYRLKVVEIPLPPLRERREDIELLVEHLLIRINRGLRRTVVRVPEELMERLRRYDWPGNVRELENRLTAGVMLSPGDTLQVELPEPADVGTDRLKEEGERIEKDPWNRSLAEVEREHIRRVLRVWGGNLGKACEVLGISRPTLRRKMQEYGLEKG